MSQYFDKDFLKFLLGFIVVVLISCVFVLLTRVYETQSTQAGTENINNTNN